MSIWPFIWREWRALRAQKEQLLYSLIFFALMVAIMTNIVPPSVLASEGAGLLWLIFFLAGLSSPGMLLDDDHADGTLDIFLIRPAAMYRSIMAKWLIHWVGFWLPLSGIFAFIPTLSDISTHSGAYWFGCAIMASCIVMSIKLIAASAIAGYSDHGRIIELIALPFTIPVLLLCQQLTSHETNSDYLLYGIAAAVISILLVIPMSARSLRGRLNG